MKKTASSAEQKTEPDSPPVPPVEQWPHRPVFLKNRDDTVVPGHDETNQALPLGVPFDFESPIFKGQILVRIRSAVSDDHETCQAYFKGKKRRMQFVVQGQFKKPVNMADLYVGGVFEKPFRFAPPKFLNKLLRLLFDRIAPGAILDFHGVQPHVLTMYSGTAQNMIITAPGDEPPDICCLQLEENMGAKFEGTFKSNKERKRKLADPRRAGQYTYDPANIYTFENYEESVDYGTYNIKIPGFGNFDLSRAIGAQPMCFSAVTKSAGETMFHFDLWHECVYDQCEFPKETNNSNNNTKLTTAVETSAWEHVETASMDASLEPSETSLEPGEVEV